MHNHLLCPSTSEAIAKRSRQSCGTSCSACLPNLQLLAHLPLLACLLADLDDGLPEALPMFWRQPWKMELALYLFAGVPSAPSLLPSQSSAHGPFLKMLHR